MASSEPPRRRSERQFVANTIATTALPPAKELRRRNKTDSAAVARPLLFWTPKEVAHLVAAWRHTIAHPPAHPRKTAGGFNVRMYARFSELVGGASGRAKSSMIAKKQLLLKSFEFINEFNEKRRSGSDAAADGVNHWFQLSRAQRKVLGEKAFLSDQRLYALLSMDQTTYEAMLEIAMFEGELNIRSPWTEEEMNLLMRAWREAISKRGRGKLPKKFSINTRIYQIMQTLSGDGGCKRTKQGLVLKKESMRYSHDFIVQYNKECRDAREQERAKGGSGVKSKSAPATWFNLSAREQERIVSRKFPKTGFVYLTEPQFQEVEFLGNETDRLNLVAGIRQGAMWTYDENVLLVQAWRETLDLPLDQLQPNVVLGTCIFERFVELSGGGYNRTERSAIIKLLALENMHKFIDDYNKTVALESKRNWFTLDRPERKRIHFNATKADNPSEHRSNTFTDIDKNTFDILTDILAKNRSVEEVAYEVDTHEQQTKPLKRKRISRDDPDDDDDSDDDSEIDEDEDDDSEEGGEGKDKTSGKDEESSSDADDDTESEDEPIRWTPRAAASNKMRTQLQSESTASPSDKSISKTVSSTSSSLSRQSGADAQGEQRQTPAQNNNFLQVPTLPPQVRSSASASLSNIVDHRSIFGDDTSDNSHSSSSSDDDGNGFASSSDSNESSNEGGKRASKEKRQLPSRKPAPSPFSLHELADLATRVPTHLGNSGNVSVHECETRAANDAQQHPASSMIESQPKVQLSPDVASIVQILHNQSEQLICVMREIRDEMKRDRKERAKFRKEMRFDREQRRKGNNDDSDDDDDGNESSRKRTHSESEDRSTRKKKANRRLSVQRDGFVVRL